MNINAAIIEQRLEGIINKNDSLKSLILAESNIDISTNKDKFKSFLFTYLCTKELLDLTEEEAIDCLVDGGNDFGTDAIHIGEEIDGELPVTIIQTKYSKSLEGNKNFPQNGIEKLIKAVTYIFNPTANLGSVNQRVETKIETIRSYIVDGVIPKVRIIACSNGIIWNDIAQSDIERAKLGNQVTWEYVNHDTLVAIQQRTKPVNTTLHLKGKALIEDMNYSRVCIGRIPAKEIAELMEQYGDRLLEKNIRRYLGLSGNRVNQEIHNTLKTDPENFYFFNNGLTLVCTDFTYNALQDSDYQVKVENLQIVNGGQTSMTLYKALQDLVIAQNLNTASILVRLYKLPKDQEDLALKITHATNSQNPVDLRDLRANDKKQIQLETSIQELGYTYRRKRNDVNRTSDITSGTVAEAVLAVMREKPHQAKFLIREHFGKLYPIIFDEELNGSQAILSVLIYRVAENRRKRPLKDDPDFVRYASCFISMQIGKKILNRNQLNSFSEINHKNFTHLKEFLEQHADNLFSEAQQDIQNALNKLYGSNHKISLQQLSATFRRGDLIQYLQ